MISNSVEPKEESTPMIILREDVIKVEHEYSHTDDWSEADTWSEADIPPDTPALMTEIEDFVSRDEKRNRLALARQTRLDITKITDELEDRDNDEDEKDHSKETGEEGSKGHNSEDEETGENSETESVATVDYEFFENKDQAKAESEDKNNDAEEAVKEERKEPTDNDTKSAVPDTNWDRNNVVEMITVQQSPPRLERPTGSSRRSTPPSARRSVNSSPTLRSSKKKLSTPRKKRSPNNKTLIVVQSQKRKYLEGFNRQECIEEHLNQNVEIMLELAPLQEKSRNDEDENSGCRKLCCARRSS